MLQLLVGNNNPYTEKEQIFDPAIIATKIRFIPYTSHMRIVCMRVELYGCQWTGKWDIWMYIFLSTFSDHVFIYICKTTCCKRQKNKVGSIF